MTKRVRVVKKSIALPELPLEMIGEVLGWVRPMSAGVVIRFSLISKTITAQTHIHLLRKWADRLYQAHQLLTPQKETDLNLMIGKEYEKNTISQSQMDALLKIEWPLEDLKDHFLKDLFAFQRYTLERNWIRRKTRIEKIDLSNSYECNILQLVRNTFYHDIKSDTIIPLIDYPGLSIVEMTSSKEVLLGQLKSLIRTRMEEIEPVLSDAAILGLESIKKLYLRSMLYELKKNSTTPLPLVPLYSYAQVFDVLIHGQHLCNKDSPVMKDIRNSLYSCTIYDARKTTDYKQVLNSYIHMEVKGRELIDRLYLALCIGRIPSESSCSSSDESDSSSSTTSSSSSPRIYPFYEDSSYSSSSTCNSYDSDSENSD